MSPAGRNPTAAYVVPFAIYVAMIALPLSPEVLFPVRSAIVLGAILLLSRPYLSLKPSYVLASLGVGIGVFAIWIGPDLLFGPAYRHFWLFDNSILGHPASSLPPAAQRSPLFLGVRIFSSVILVPILEELFWRGWLMRWLIDRQFLKIPLGTYQAGAFWIVALLFASEHGPYWEVGLLAGVAYNLWIVRARNLADCILAHSVTNGVLAAYVLIAGQWQYWL
ncbi:MAG TPA: CAAX prenyl protease-related protein [Bryobacteraceae bacterium]|nr:CAAX prenyl protease-related protein [Bryobacteraceae bacterium]